MCFFKETGLHKNMLVRYFQSKLERSMYAVKCGIPAPPANISRLRQSFPCHLHASPMSLLVSLDIRKALRANLVFGACKQMLGPPRKGEADQLIGRLLVESTQRD